MTVTIIPPSAGPRHPKMYQLLNADGSPMSSVSASDTAFKAASQEGKMRLWNPAKGSADSDLLPEKPTIDARSVDLVRNEVSAKSGIDTLLDLVIGTGPTIVPIPDYKALGLDKEWAAEWARNVQGIVHDYIDSEAMDVTRSGNLTDNLRMGLRTEIAQGEQAVVPYFIEGRPGSDFATCFQWIDPDRISNPLGTFDSQYLRSGIEIDEFGAPQRYHVQKVHPADVGTFAAIEGAYEWEAIDALTEWGRPSFIHVFERERPDQHRGLSMLAAMMPFYKDASDYRGAEVKAALANAIVAGFTESSMEMSQLLDMFGGDASSLLAARAEYILNMQPGSILPLFPGDKFASHNPSRPNAAYEGFMRAIKKDQSLGFNLPHQIAMKDTDGDSYSSLKGAFNMARRAIAPRQSSSKTKCVDKIVRCLMEELVGTGIIEAPGFWDNNRTRNAWLRTRIIWDGEGWLDPAREAQAAQLRIALGISTYEIECAAQGLDWREVMEQRSVEQRFMKALDLDQNQLTTSIALAPQTPERPEQ
ncbi:MULTISPECIES: phage portal protein [unclassified Ensifer]|uniref:phage portal protein n=1 Tax=unclassified Ensifer TaxID=2633371 RepID=UPI0009F494F9|nr:MULTISPECIES: phage portal protein [unclassified Ensifer]